MGRRCPNRAGALEIAGKVDLRASTPRSCVEEATWLSPDEADETLAALREELTWEQREIVLFGRRILQPRLIAWAGDVGYRYSGQTLEPRAFTATAGRLLARVRLQTGAEFKHVLANRYRSGDDSMGLHGDDEPELGPARRWPSCRSARLGGSWSSHGGSGTPGGTSSRSATAPCS